MTEKTKNLLSEHKIELIDRIRTNIRIGEEATIEAFHEHTRWLRIGKNHLARGSGCVLRIGRTQLDHLIGVKPVIVGGDADKHGVVSTASYEARVFGVRSAMPSSRARTLPAGYLDIRCIAVAIERSRAQSWILRDEKALIFNRSSIDEAFLDVTDARIPNIRRHRSTDSSASPILEASHAPSGSAPAETIAKIASDFDKPSGMTIIYQVKEIEFLSPLPIRTMSGVGERQEEGEAEGPWHRHVGRLLAHASIVFCESIYGKTLR